MKEIEEEEILFQSRKKRQAARQAAAKADTETSAQNVRDQVIENKIGRTDDAATKVETYKGAKFY